MNGVDHPSHQDTEKDVAVEVAALGDRPRNDSSAGRGKGALRLYSYSYLVGTILLSSPSPKSKVPKSRPKGLGLAIVERQV